MDILTFPLPNSSFTARVDGKPTLWIQTPDHAIRIAPVNFITPTKDLLAELATLR